MSRDPQSPLRLMVEGKNDVMSIGHFINSLGFNMDDETLPYIHACGSDYGVIQSISASIKTFDRVGFVIDADQTPSARWDSILEHSRKADKTINFIPDEDGVIINQPNKKIGFWVMPDNISVGKIEDFLFSLVPSSGDDCLTYANTAVDIAKSTKNATFKDVHRSKSVLHTWLAWQDPPGLPYGTAIQKNMLDNNKSDLAVKFFNWFSKLFLD